MGGSAFSIEVLQFDIELPGFFINAFDPCFTNAVK